MEIFDPTALPGRREVRLAPRPGSLRRLRLGLVENTKFNSDTLLLKLAERLGQRYGTTLSLMTRKRSPSHEIDEAAIRGLQNQADLVVSGIGD